MHFIRRATLHYFSLDLQTNLRQDLLHRKVSKQTVLVVGQQQERPLPCESWYRFRVCTALEGSSLWSDDHHEARPQCWLRTLKDRKGKWKSFRWLPYIYLFSSLAGWTAIKSAYQHHKKKLIFFLLFIIYIMLANYFFWQLMSRRLEN